VAGTQGWPHTLGASALVLVGCGVGSDSPQKVPDAGSKSFARLAVVLTAPRDGGVTVGAAGRLLRYRGVDLDSAQVLAGSRDRERAPLGRCAVLDDEAQLEDALATSPPDAAVQMLDAGDVLVRVAGQTVKMSPRYVPDIVPFVSGVVYDGEMSTDSELGSVGGREEAQTEAWIAGFGGQQVGRFVTAAEVPAMPRFLSIAGAAPAGAAMDAGADVPVSWQADDSSRGSVTLTVSRETGPGLRCRVADTGKFTIPAAALSRVLEGAREENLALSVERSRRSPFSAPGLDAAEVEVTVRDVVTLRVN
jgi:hypothetical protein